MISGPLLRHTWRSHRLRVLVLTLALGVWGFLMPVIYATFGVQMEAILKSGIIPAAFLRLLGADPFSLAGAVALGSVHPVALGTLLREISQGNVVHRHQVRPVAAQEHDCPLTQRELEILRLVAEGHTNGHIARQLWVTEQTVKFHLSNIYRKLDVTNRTEASRWAQINGLLSTEVEEVEAHMASTNGAVES